MDSDSGGSGQTGLHTVIGQRHLVVTRRGFLSVVRETAAVAAVWVVACAGIQFQGSGGRHQQDVAQIRVPRAAEVRVAESDDRRIRVAVAGAIFIDTWLVFPVHVVRDCVRVWAKLNPTERHARPGESVSHPVGSYEWIDIICLG